MILYLHGGGYFACSPSTHRALIARLAVATGARCVAPSYRLAPEHPFPAGLEECLAAYRALVAGGVSPSGLVLAGDSAGGGLTLAVLQRLRTEGATLPRAALLLSPWVDLAAEDGSMVVNAQYDYLPHGEIPEPVLRFLGDNDPRDPLLSAINADLHGMPPMCMLSGSLELFVDQNRAFAEKARAHGVAVNHIVEPDMVHVYPLLADVSTVARRSFQQMAEFLREHAS
jgi:acetyl esterase/lipase